MGHALLRCVEDAVGAGEDELCVDCGGGGVIYENWGGGRGVEDVYDVMVNFGDMVDDAKRRLEVCDKCGWKGCDWCYGWRGCTRLGRNMDARGALILADRVKEGWKRSIQAAQTPVRADDGAFDAGPNATPPAADGPTTTTTEDTPRKRRREAAVAESARITAARSRHVVIGRPEWELADMGPNGNYTRNYVLGEEVSEERSDGCCMSSRRLYVLSNDFSRHLAPLCAA